MHPIKSYLNAAGHRLLREHVGRLAAFAALLIGAYLTLYFASVLLIKSMSLTWTGVLAIPLLTLAAFAVMAPIAWARLRDQRKVAREIEDRVPELQLSLRSALDFLEHKTEDDSETSRQIYLDQVHQRLQAVQIPKLDTRPWGRYASTAVVAALMTWFIFGGQLRDKFYNPTLSFGQTHLDLAEGSITIFEPDYTQIPSRTLPLKPGLFKAYAGSRVRFLVQAPEDARALYISEGEDANATPLELNEERQATFEFVLLENKSLEFLLSERSGSGRTQPYTFEINQDERPEIALRSHTPEGPINILDPLIIETEVKDDFGVKELVAVITYDQGEKRIPLNIPPERRKHFINRQQWYISDFDLPDIEKFSVQFEAIDNKPIGEPGMGRSASLTYELESPDKKYDEFMELARQLLDGITHTLGDNLETTFANTQNRDRLVRSEELGRQISSGLYQSLSMTNKLISKVRETPNMSRLDQNFLFEFRNGVSRYARKRGEMNMIYSTLQFRQSPSEYVKLRKLHGDEELGVEGLTYDLLLQLKMWAVLELERRQNQMEQDLDALEEMLENAENMDQQELQELFDKLMNEVMKDFQEMMARAAEQMEMNMSEFLNMDAAEFQDQFEELRKQIMEALKEGDMKKAKKLMEQMRAAMEESLANMRQNMGQQSPEMQAMMQNMRELMGLLRELKAGEEELERDTQALKREIDEQMGGNRPELSEQQQREQQEATARIQELLNNLYNRLVAYKTDGMIQELVEEIAENRQTLEQLTNQPEEANRLRREINGQERMLDFLSRDGLDNLQNMTLRNLSQVERLQEYLDQGELMLGLETGVKLDTSLLQSARLSEQTPSRRIQEEVQPAETFDEARQELQKILDALRNLRQNLEQRRQEFMQANGEQRQQELAERQAQLNQMIQEFMERTGESFDQTQIERRLRDIGLSMRNAEQRLGDSRMEGGIQFEQAALQKIGEMMEQLQQSQRPGGQPRPMFMSGGRNDGFNGDPSLRDIYIPESEKQATKDQMKEAVRKQLQKNLPDSYGKEIRKYYEKLIDQ